MPKSAQGSWVGNQAQPTFKAYPTAGMLQPNAGSSSFPAVSGTTPAPVVAPPPSPTVGTPPRDALVRAVMRRGGNIPSMQINGPEFQDLMQPLIFSGY